MKKQIITIFAIAALAATSVYAQVMGRLPGIIAPLDRGLKTDTTIRNILLTKTNQPYIMILDGGTWLIATNLTIPTNVTLVMSRDAIFSINATKSLRIHGEFVAGSHNVFTGLGTANYDPAVVTNGVGQFPYRCPEWGHSTQFNIGIGYLEQYIANQVAANLPTGQFNTNASYYFIGGDGLGGSTQSVYGLTVRGPARFSNTVDFAQPITMHGGTNEGNFETDTLVVNSNITASSDAVTNLLKDSYGAMETNRPFFGFSAHSPSGSVQNMVADAFVRLTNVSVEIADPKSTFDNSRFSPTNAGYWRIGGAVNMKHSRAGGAGTGFDSDRSSLHLVKNGFTNGTGVAFGQSNIALFINRASTRRDEFSGGSAIMYANGAGDFFDLYFYSGEYAETNIGTMFNADFVGR